MVNSSWRNVPSLASLLFQGWPCVWIWSPGHMLEYLSHVDRGWGPPSVCWPSIVTFMLRGMSPKSITCHPPRTPNRSIGLRTLAGLPALIESDFSSCSEELDMVATRQDWSLREVTQGEVFMVITLRRDTVGLCNDLPYCPVLLRARVLISNGSSALRRP